MPELKRSADFSRLREQTGRIDVSGKTIFIPVMSPRTSTLASACFRAFGVRAVTLETYRGLHLGKEFTSGKECFPCQVTLGDILLQLRDEKERLGEDFDSGRYAYFLPEAAGPCRFGMYSKMQRLVLDRFPEFRDIPITCLSSEDAYRADGIMPPRLVRPFRKLGYICFVIGDCLDRMVWRVRPYEKSPGAADKLAAMALDELVAAVEAKGAAGDLRPVLEPLEEAARQMAALIDRSRPRLPRIGVVGEIYLRSHPDSNQDLARQIERFGGEVTVASLTEWVNYVTFDKSRRKWLELAGRVRARRLGGLLPVLGSWLAQQAERAYMRRRQKMIYARVRRHLDIAEDHGIEVLESRLDKDRIYSFDIGTETPLSLGGALEYIHEGFDGIVNVFPFTCMPGAACSAILVPLLQEKKIPYFDAPCDGSFQPNREAALRTFLYQAAQHRERKQSGG